MRCPIVGRSQHVLRNQLTNYLPPRTDVLIGRNAQLRMFNLRHAQSGLLFSADDKIRLVLSIRCKRPTTWRPAIPRYAVCACVCAFVRACVRVCSCVC